jgi:predicted acyltransferase
MNTSLPNRILSLDVLRGLTIAFMIIVNTPGSWEHVFAPLRHAEWNGCTPTDLVFPFFTFIVGLSMAYSLKGASLPDGFLGKAIKRGLIIFLIGLLLNYFPFTKEISNLRIFGVLQRIACAYMISALIIYLLKEKHILIAAFAVLGIYACILQYGVPENALTLEHNIVRKIDLLLLGESHVYKGYGMPFDPEGIVSTLGTVGNILLGYFLAKNLISKKEITSSVRYASLFGFLLVCLGLIWQMTGLPINKPIWTSSYSLFTSGLCSILFALMMYIIDYKKYINWSFPLKVFGMNAIAAYTLSGLLVKVQSLFKINDETFLSIWYDKVTSPIFGATLGSLVSALSYCAIIWIISYIMYKKGVFLKV